MNTLKGAIKAEPLGAANFRETLEAHLSASVVLGASAFLLNHLKSLTEQKYFQKIVFKI